MSFMSRLRRKSTPIDRLEQLFIPPDLLEDEGTPRVVRPLVRLCAIGFALALPYSILRTLIMPQRLEGIIYSTAMFVTMGLVLFIVRTKRVRLAVNVFLGGLWVILTIATLNTGGTRAPVYGTLTFVVMVAALLYGWRLASVYATATIAVGLVLAVLDPAGILLVPFATPLSAWLTHTVTLMLVGGTAYFMLRRSEQALDHAQKALAEREKMHHALQESEERLRLIASATSDYTFSAYLNVQGDWDSVFLTGALETITGYTPSEYVETGGWRAILHPDDLEQDEQDMETLRKNQPVETELRIIRKDGELRWVRVQALPVWDEQANCLIGINGGVHDITKRKQAEMALRASQHLLEKTLASLNEAIFIVDPGSRVIRDSNAAVETIFGYTREEVIGRNTEFLHVDHQMYTQFKGTHEAEKVSKGALQTEYQMRRKDGSVFESEHVVTEILDDSGHPSQVVSVVRDITERKKAEATSKYYSEFLSLVTSLSTEFINLSLDEIDEGIHRALKLISEFGRVDRIRVGLVSQDLSTFNIEYEWRAPGIARGMTDEVGVVGREYSAESFVWVIEQLKQAETLVYEHVEDVPDEAQALREVMKTLGVHSGVLVPLLINQSLIGYATYYAQSNRPWPERIVDLFKIVSEMLANALERKRKDVALHQSEERYRRVVNDQVDFICRWLPPEGKLTFVNESYCQHYGKRKEELLNSSIFNLPAPEDHDAVRTQILDRLYSLSPANSIMEGEYEGLDSDGQKRIYQWRDRALFDDRGQIVEVQSIGRDITERKRAEVELRQSEERFRIAFENAAVGRVILSPTGKLLKANRAYCEMTGYGEEALLTKTWYDTVHPDFHAVVSDLVNQLTSGEIEAFQIELLLQLSDGHTIWGHVNTTVVRNDQGSAHLFIIDVEDITNRKQAEESLRKSEARNRAILEAMPDLMFRLSQDGTHLDFYTPSPEQLFVQPKFFLGKHVDEVLPSDVAAIYQSNIAATLGSTEMQIFEYHLDLPALGDQEYEGRMVVSGPDEVLAIVRNITERKKAEEASEYYSEFLGLLTSLSTEFINLSIEKIDGGIQRALQLIGEFAMVDRIRISLFSQDMSTFGIQYEWRADGIDELGQNGIREYPTENYAWAIGQLRDSEFLSFANPEQIPEKARVYRERMEATGIQSGFLLPLLKSGTLMGLITYQSYTKRDWPDRIVDLFKIVSEMLANALERKRAEEALKEREESLRQLSDAAVEGIGIAQQGRVVLANARLAEMLGYETSELIEKSVMEIVAPESRETVLERVRSGYEGMYEHMALRKDGTVFPVEAQGRAMIYRGVPVRVTAIRDITERKLAEEKLRASEEHLRLALQAAHMGTWDWEIATNVVTWSENVEPIFGLEKGEFAGTYAAYADLIHPADRPAAGRTIAEALDGPSDDYAIEHRIAWVDDSLHWIEGKGRVYRDDTGKPLRMIGTVTDITERKRADEELHRLILAKDQAEIKLRQLNEELEARVEQRTYDLSRAMEALEQEIEERTQIEANEREQRKLAEALGDTAATISSTLNREEIFKRILENISNVVPNDNAHVMLIEDDGCARVVDYRGEDTADYIEGLFNLHVCVEDFHYLNLMYQTRQPVIIPDIVADSHWIMLREDTSYRSYIGIPIVLDDEVIGFINVHDSHPDWFNQNQMKWLQAFADHVGIAIRNAQLYEQARSSAIEEERQRLARDLHDAVSQTLFSASAISEVLPRLMAKNSEKVPEYVMELGQLTRGAMAEMRSLLVELRPEALVNTELGILIKQLCDAFTGNTRIAVEASIMGKVNLPPDMQIAFYRVAQEALNNIAKHAQASNVVVTLSRTKDVVELDIRDDGIGFDMNTIPPDHFGIRIMRERIKLIDADLQISSQSGTGTEIRLRKTLS